MSDFVTKDQCLIHTMAVLEKLESLEKRLFVDNGNLSIQTRLERHDLVIRALLWVVSIIISTVIAGSVSACVILVRALSKM